MKPLADSLRPLVGEVREIKEEARHSPRLRWATVTSVSPLRIQLEGDPAPLAGTPQTLVHPSLLAIGQRVEVIIQNARPIIQGIGGGIAGSDLAGRNLIINGNFQINQRGYVSGTVVSGLTYGFDRWRMSAGTSLTFTAAPQGQTVTINSAGTLRQTIERRNVLPGTYVLSWEGTARGRAYGVGGAVISDSGVLVFDVDGTSDVVIEFMGFGGAARSLGKVQLERGKRPTPYEHRHYTQELLLCQRYFYVIPVGVGSVYNFYWAVGLSGGGQVWTGGHHPVEMRTSPTITGNGPNDAGFGIFRYENYSAAAAGNYAVSLTADTRRMIANYYSSHPANGGNYLEVGRTAGYNINPIWVNAEF